MRFLIAEDSKNIARIYYDIIEDICLNNNIEYKIYSIKNLDEFNNIKNLHFDYAILDWFLENKDTSKPILEKLKNKTKIVIISGYIYKLNGNLSKYKDQGVISGLYEKPITAYGEKSIEEIILKLLE